MIIIKKDQKQLTISTIYGTLVAHEISDDVEQLITISEDIFNDLESVFKYSRR